jgi:hypothetical protein
VQHCHYLADWVAGALRDGEKGSAFLHGIVDEKHTYCAQATLNKFWLLESFRFAAHGASEEAIVHLLLHSGIANTDVPHLDETDNAKVEQILLLGIYEIALQSARGNAMFQALFADKNSRKVGVEGRGVPEKYVEVSSDKANLQPAEIIDEAADNQQSLSLPASVEVSSDDSRNTAEKHSLTVVEKLESATPSGWMVEDSSNKRFFLRRTSRSEVHNIGDMLQATILSEHRKVEHRGKSIDFQLIALEA